MSPADVAENLMPMSKKKKRDPDLCFSGLVEALKQAKEGAAAAAAKAKAACHAKEHNCLLRRLSGKMYISDSDPMDGSTSSSNDDAPPHADANLEEGHNRAGYQKGRGRRGNGDFWR